MATLTPSTRITLSGTLIDESGLVLPWDPDPLVAVTTRGGQLVFTQVAAGTTTKVHAIAQPAGATTLVVYPVQTGAAQNVTVGGGVSDAGIPIPPGGWVVWAHASAQDSDVYVTNPGTVPVAIGVGIF